MPLEVFLSKWAIHFAEAALALLIVWMISLVVHKYRATSRDKKVEQNDQSTRSNVHQAAANQASPAPEKALDHYIGAFFDTPESKN